MRAAHKGATADNQGYASATNNLQFSFVKLCSLRFTQLLINYC